MTKLQSVIDSFNSPVFEIRIGLFARLIGKTIVYKCEQCVEGGVLIVGFKNTEKSGSDRQVILSLADGDNLYFPCANKYDVVFKGTSTSRMKEIKPSDIYILDWPESNLLENTPALEEAKK